jgi:Tetratricopeptide repeat
VPLPPGGARGGTVSDLAVGAAHGALAAGHVGQLNLYGVAFGGGVTWPHQVGVVPPRARSFQHRNLVGQVRDAVAGGGTAVLSQVLSGAGGVGKSQLAADYARTALQSGAIDLLVWITATTSAAAVSGFAQAAIEVLGADPGHPVRAAQAFLAWLEPKAGPPPCRWLVVLDDLADPADLRGLWPADSPHGRTLITTRRRDAALSRDGRRMITVGLFSPGEATAYLTTALAAHGRQESAAELEGLAADLGHLPLALAQSAAYLLDAGLDTATYRRLLADRTSRLADLVPETTSLPDDQTTTVAAAWSLSIARADQLHPAGLAQPMLQLGAMLDPNGIPASVLISRPALDYLAAARTGAQEHTEVKEQQALGALRALHRLNLIDHTADTPHQAVHVHQLVQRAVLDGLDAGQRHRLARAAADALSSVWPPIERDTDLAQALRNNTNTLSRRAGDSLWRPDGHPVLFRLGKSLGESGQVSAAASYFGDLVRTARRNVGADHSDTLNARLRHATWRGSAGDPAGAAEALERLRADRDHILGPEHPSTLVTRYNLARWQGKAGDRVGAIDELASLLAEQERILGPYHPDTLATRNGLARWQGEVGDPARAAEAFARLLADRDRVLGPHHPSTLTTRGLLAHWQGRAGDPVGAAEEFTRLLEDYERILGPSHPGTLSTRNNLAHWQGRAGDPVSAAEAFARLLEDRNRILGPDHPDTLVTRHNLAHWQGRAGDPAGAMAALARLIEDQERILGPRHPDTLVTRNTLAQWRMESGDDTGQDPPGPP